MLERTEKLWICNLTIIITMKQNCQIQYTSNLGEFTGPILETENSDKNY